eukprot:TRINITY_DN80478_c0_g1_i1.p1 TRINITY_DN80478_c0_g1~~TRINITY_DN80478_c0_g1_i1.p1  ORF type:complete len:101 (-),score=44.35 TRINITY_DN80478_c0_g1_i1:440-742(-)
MENDEIRVIPEEQPAAPEKVEEPATAASVVEKEETVETIEEENPVVGEVRPREDASSMVDEEKEDEETEAPSKARKVSENHILARTKRWMKDVQERCSLQ